MLSGDLNRIGLPYCLLSAIYFFKEFIYLFLDRGEEREKERERNSVVVSHAPPTGDLTWPAPQACALTGN